MKRLRPSPSMVVAVAALMVALGGTSYAVSQLPKNSVGAKQLRRGAVTSAKLRSNAVTSAKVAKDALTGLDLNEASLGQVPSAVNAAHATNADHAVAADHAGSSGALDKLVYRAVGGSVPPLTPPDTAGTASVAATCDPGQHVVGGGVSVEDVNNTSVVDSYPSGSTAWTAHVDNSDTAPHTFTVFAVCAVSVTVG